MMRSSNSLHCLKDKVKADVIEVPELLANVFGEDSDAVLCATTARESRRVCNEEELSVRLKGWLENYPGTSLPHDLAIYESVDDAVTSLVKSVCELEIDGDVGSDKRFGTTMAFMDSKSSDAQVTFPERVYTTDEAMTVEQAVKVEKTTAKEEEERMAENEDKGAELHLMKVAKIMETVDRALFVPDGSPAYEDSPMQIGFNATISAPHMHATCLQLLEKNLHLGMHALDVGSSSYLRSYVPPVDECIFRPWYSSSLVVENGICYHFVPYVRVHDSPDSSKLKVENFCFLPKMIFDKHEDLRNFNQDKWDSSQSKMMSDYTSLGASYEMDSTMEASLWMMDFYHWPIGTTYQIHWSMKHAKTIRWNLTANAARPNPQGSDHYGTIPVMRTIVLANLEVNINGKLRYIVNQITKTNYKKFGTLDLVYGTRHSGRNSTISTMLPQDTLCRYTLIHGVQYWFLWKTRECGI
ncbi:protein-L-isoaspartate O-methyltransferase 1 isoform X2 [Tanacetum coccineum]